MNYKGKLQTRLLKTGETLPEFKSVQMEDHRWRCDVTFRGHQFRSTDIQKTHGQEYVAFQILEQLDELEVERAKQKGAKQEVKQVMKQIVLANTLPKKIDPNVEYHIIGNGVSTLPNVTFHLRLVMSDEVTLAVMLYDMVKKNIKSPARITIIDGDVDRAVVTTGVHDICSE